MRVLVCGSRDWTHESPIRRALSVLDSDSVIIHGAARGADKIADKIAREFGMDVEPYPADWSKGLSAGPVRNQKMLDEGKPDKVIAFPLPQSRGTWDMINRARKAGVPVQVVYP